MINKLVFVVVIVRSLNIEFVFFFKKKFNSTYKNLVETIFKFETFYFSYSYDITHSLQRLQNTTPDFLMTPLFVRVIT
jgi:hypothetical protein